jgi:capsular polysaccharide biosynthesis protein
MVVALGSALLAYASAAQTQFAAICSFEAVIHNTTTPAQSTEAIDFNNKLAAREVALADAAGLYATVGKNLAVSGADLHQNTSISSTQGLGTFLVQVVDPKRDRAPILANAVCDQYVFAIQKQRADEVNTEIQGAKTRIDTAAAEAKRLLAIPKAKRTLSDTTNLKAQVDVLNGNASLIGSVLSLPPDSIRVLTRATNAAKHDTRKLSRNLLIGATAGLLACFLYIILGEVLTQQRRRPPTPAAS